MSYIGQHLPPDVFGAYTVDTFTGDGSATTFTLSKEPASDSALLVVVDNVIQQPTTNFTVSGTTLTIVGTAILSGITGYAIHTQGKIPVTTATAVDLNGVSDTLILDADADTTISADTDDQIDFKLGGVDEMTMSSTGIVINEGSNDRDFRIESNSNTHMLFVDGGGDCVSIGQSNDMGKMVNITSGTSNAADIALGSTIGGTGSAYGGHLNLFLGAQSNSGSGNADTQAGDHLGRISFNGQGTDYSYQGAEIDVVVQTGDGSDNRSNQGTAMVLKTMNVGSTGYAEHFRIAQDGTLTATDTSIGSNSDERLKENIQDYTYDIAKFKQFKPKTFDWKNPLEHDGKSNNRGFIAQEISAIDDYWIDQVNISMKQAEGNPAKDLDLIPAESNGMHLVYTSKLGKKDAMYVSIIQQLITRIEALEG